MIEGSGLNLLSNLLYPTTCACRAIAAETGNDFNLIITPSLLFFIAQPLCACRAIAAETGNDFNLNRQWNFVIQNGPDIIAQAYTRSMNNLLQR